MITELLHEQDIRPGHRALDIIGGPAETSPYDRIPVTGQDLDRRMDLMPV